MAAYRSTLRGVTHSFPDLRTCLTKASPAPEFAAWLERMQIQTPVITTALRLQLTGTRLKDDAVSALPSA